MRVLLAEDERDLNELITSMLVKNHYSVDSVFDGQEAIDYLQGIKFDLIILDIMMPKKNGIEVVSELRKMGISTPVIMLTAKSELDDKILGLDSGADDYLTKPFAMRELLARLRSLARRTSETVKNELQYEDILLSSENFLLKSKNSSKTFLLANKEYQLLEMMMRNQSQILSLDILMDKIWGYDTDTDISVVWVYISNLRKKLTALNSKVVIKSKRNTGYYLDTKKE